MSVYVCVINFKLTHYFSKLNVFLLITYLNCLIFYNLLFIYYSIAMKRHQGKSYKKKHLIGCCTQFQRMSPLIP